ncbi:hypothetical protein [Streptomyces sp. NPDC001809]
MGSLTALHRAVDEARRTRAELVAVLAWLPPEGEVTQRYVVTPPAIDFRRAAADRLLETMGAAFGGAGPMVPWQGLVARGRPGRRWWKSPTASGISW